MSDLNKFLCTGRLTHGIELRYTPDGTATCKLSVAVNERWTDKSTQAKKERVLFVDVEVWGHAAEACKQYLGKGSKVLVEGSLRMDEWEDKKTGEKRKKYVVKATTPNGVQFLDPPKQRDESVESAPAAQQEDSDDLPFGMMMPFLLGLGALGGMVA